MCRRARCAGERLRLIALIEEAQALWRMFGHLGLPTEVPTASLARPIPLESFDHYVGDDIAFP